MNLIGDDGEDSPVENDQIQLREEQEMMQRYTSNSALTGLTMAKNQDDNGLLIKG